MQETKLECGIGLRLCLVLGLSDVHQLAQVMYGHLHVSILGMHICKQFVRVALLVAGASFHFTLADLEETGQACDRLV
jgi:hypothetical protein